MKRPVLAAPLLALAMALPAAAQSADPNGGDSVMRSGAAAVGDASILPDAGANTVLPQADGGASMSTIDGGTTRSVSPSLSLPDTTLPGSTPSDTTQPGSGQPGSGISGTVAPRTGGGISNSLGGATSTGPTSGGSSAY